MNGTKVTKNSEVRAREKVFSTTSFNVWIYLFGSFFFRMFAGVRVLLFAGQFIILFSYSVWVETANGGNANEKTNNTKCHTQFCGKGDLCVQRLRIAHSQIFDARFELMHRKGTDTQSNFDEECSIVRHLDNARPETMAQKTLIDCAFRWEWVFVKIII